MTNFKIAALAAVSILSLAAAPAFAGAPGAPTYTSYGNGTYGSPELADAPHQHTSACNTVCRPQCPSGTRWEQGVCLSTQAPRQMQRTQRSYSAPAPQRQVRAPAPRTNFSSLGFRNVQVGQVVTNPYSSDIRYGVTVDGFTRLTGQAASVWREEIRGDHNVRSAEAIRDGQIGYGEAIRDGMINRATDSFYVNNSANNSNTNDQTSYQSNYQSNDNTLEGATAYGGIAYSDASVDFEAALNAEATTGPITTEVTGGDMTGGDIDMGNLGGTTSGGSDSGNLGGTSGASNSPGFGGSSGNQGTSDPLGEDAFLVGSDGAYRTGNNAVYTPTAVYVAPEYVLPASGSNNPGFGGSGGQPWFVYKIKIPLFGGEFLLAKIVNKYVYMLWRVHIRILP